MFTNSIGFRGTDKIYITLMSSSEIFKKLVKNQKRERILRNIKVAKRIKKRLLSLFKNVENSFSPRVEINRYFYTYVDICRIT